MIFPFGASIGDFERCGYFSFAITLPNTSRLFGLIFPTFCEVYVVPPDVKLSYFVNDFFSSSSEVILNDFWMKISFCYLEGVFL